MSAIEYEIFHYQQWPSEQLIGRHIHLGYHKLREVLDNATTWVEVGIDLVFPADRELGWNHRFLLRLLDQAGGGGRRVATPLNEAFRHLWIRESTYVEGPWRVIGLVPFPGASGEGGRLRALLLLPADLVSNLHAGQRGATDIDIGRHFGLFVEPLLRGDVHAMRYDFFATDFTVHDYCESPPKPVSSTWGRSLMFRAPGPGTCLYIANQEGVFRLTRAGVDRICDKFTDSVILSGLRICVDGRETVWVATDSGLLSVDKSGRLTTSVYHDVLPTWAIRAVNVDSLGRLLIGTSKGVGVCDPDGTCTFLPADLKSRVVCAIFGADNGDIWVQGKGLTRFGADGAIQAFTSRQKIDGDIRAVLPRAGGAVWIVTCGWSNDVVEVKPGATRATPVPYFERNPTGRVQAACHDRAGRLWLLLDTGNLLCLQPRETPRLLALRAPHLTVATVLPGPDGGLWVAASDGALFIGEDEIQRALGGPPVLRGVRPEPFGEAVPVSGEPDDDHLRVEGRHVALVGLSRSKRGKAARQLEECGAIVQETCDEHTEFIIGNKRVARKLHKMAQFGVRVLDASALDRLAKPSGAPVTCAAPLRFQVEATDGAADTDTDTDVDTDTEAAAAAPDADATA